jgi:hypothetical protein
MTLIEIIECEQGSDEWLLAHCGIASASNFKIVQATGKAKDTASIERMRHVYKKAGELITGQPDPSGYKNDAMARGNEMEEEARLHYTFLNPQAKIAQVGFIRNGKAGCSPDALIDHNGGLEIKTAWPHILLAHKAKKEFPLEHKPQVQGNLWIADREWWDLVIYWPRMKPFIVRAYRDEPYIRDLETAVDQFNNEVAAVVEAYNQGD